MSGRFVTTARMTHDFRAGESETQIPQHKMRSQSRGRPCATSLFTSAAHGPTPHRTRPRPAALGIAARYAWAMLLARIYEVFPLVCPHCGGAMRIIAFITDAPTVRDILVRLGEPITPPTVAPARGPPMWDMPPAGQREIDPQAQPAPDYEFDQRVTW